ncbi:hypothetical protein R69888_02801 [Paraburkholderia haematera]|uniref:Uncharacterized protein n=1 Tax=Paraburkholderia haematera TaxID=2793077 RepID=A0ABN7LGV1_9BURK|nr:hypothetical protein R69888_02801 [Paraburkholderia haematera]
MNRPLALIEGDLAIPKPLPFDSLPPPFGSGRRAAHSPYGLAQGAARLARPSRVSQGTKHILFYKLPPKRVDSHRFDMAMVEAKRYLDSGNVLPRSSRSDHILGAAIFAGCSLALAWLLVTCTVRDAGKARELTAKLPSVPALDGTPADRPQRPAPLAAKDKQVVPQSVGPAASAVPETAIANSTAAATIPRSGLATRSVVVAVAPASPAASHSAPTLTSGSRAKNNDRTRAAPRNQRTLQSQEITPRLTALASTREATRSYAEKAGHKVAVARMTATNVDDRLALSSTAGSATRPSVSKQAEWPGSSSSARDGAVGDAAWVNWAVQQSRTHVATRASTAADTDWNTRMTQRRVTDNPEAFRAGAGTSQK